MDLAFVTRVPQDSIPEGSTESDKGANTTGSIYISNRVTAESVPVLRNHGITTVITMIEPDRTPGARRTTGFTEHKKANIKHYRFNIPDETIYPYERPKFLATVRLAIRTARNALLRGEKVLIHCRSGVNRSPLTIGLLLVEEFGMSPSEALDLVTQANEQRQVPVLINESFRDLIAMAVPKQCMM